jgi:hypothetical protein
VVKTDCFEKNTVADAVWNRASLLKQRIRFFDYHADWMTYAI